MMIILGEAYSTVGIYVHPKIHIENYIPEKSMRLEFIVLPNTIPNVPQILVDRVLWRNRHFSSFVCKMNIYFL